MYLSFHTWVKIDVFEFANADTNSFFNLLRTQTASPGQMNRTKHHLHRVPHRSRKRKRETRHVQNGGIGTLTLWERCVRKNSRRLTRLGRTSHFSYSQASFASVLHTALVLICIQLRPQSYRCWPQPAVVKSLWGRRQDSQGKPCCTPSVKRCGWVRIRTKDHIKDISGPFSARTSILHWAWLRPSSGILHSRYASSHRWGNQQASWKTKKGTCPVSYPRFSHQGEMLYWPRRAAC